tara:strand:- start:136 stop:384 length:249 start_codon:yes stop_codon:yes gene_type:complete
MTESVAYMSEEGVLFKEMPPNPMFELVPLYKRGELRELSDEEILETAKTMPTIDGATMEQAYILFARAILKKASGGKHEELG